MKKTGFLFLLLSLADCNIAAPLTSPSVADAIPADGAAVKLELDLPNGGVNVTSVNPTSVTLTDVATGQAVAAAAQTDNDSERLTLKPRGELEFATEYRFDLTNAVEDVTGQAVKPYSSTFTTLLDGVPAVVGTRPADGDDAVSVYDTAAINADISSAAGGVDAASLTSRSVYLTDLSTGERVAGTPSTSGGGNTITLALDAELTDGTEYQFDVTSGVRAGDGTPFIPYTSTFSSTRQV